MSCRLLYNNSALLIHISCFGGHKLNLKIFIFLFQIPATIDDLEGKKDPVLEGIDLV